MCGIFARVASEPVADTLIEGLKRLEYRGYDSAGIATMETAGLSRICAVGKVGALEAAVRVEPPKGNIGIGHTRWATHGAPSERNAHPHMAPGVAVVHNGIIENHRELRHDLAEHGATFRSETDTEVIPWLMAQHMAAGATAAEALRSAGDRMKGAFAVAALAERDPDTLHVLRRGSPLAIAHGEKGAVLASDPNALAGFAREAVMLEDGDSATLSRGGIEIRNEAGQKVQRQQIVIDEVAPLSADDGFQHHMLREIHEQPQVLQRILTTYDSVGSILGRLSFDFRRVNRVTLIACGTSYLAASLAKRWFQEIAGIPAEIAIASEYRYEPLAPAMPGEIAIVISQSGETADTVGAMQRLKERRVPVLGLVNQVGSTIAREADCHIPLLAGQEIGVASTKAFVAQLAVLARLVLAAASRRGVTGVSNLQNALSRVGDLVAAVLHNEPAVMDVAQRVVQARSAIFVGRGSLYPVALEGALKMKETSYIHAEGFAAGELKHGPIALVDQNTPIFALASSGPLFDKCASNIREIAARGGRIVLVGDRAALLALSDVATHALTVPHCPDFIQPIISTVPLQLLAYYVAVLRGLDVDRPRNLAKSVTVE